MNQDELFASVELIKASLNSRESKTITGALLGELIRKVTPELDLKQIYPAGQKMLTRFTADYFPGYLERKARQGSDIVYSINSDGVENGESARYEYWLTFARPNNPIAILADIESTKMTLSGSTNSSSNTINIQSVSSTELLNFRREFVEGLDHNKFDSAIYVNSSKYAEWLEHVRAQGGNLFSEWSAFRIKKLHALFKSRLDILGVPEEQAHNLADLMGRCQRNAPKRPPIIKALDHSAKPESTSESFAQPNIVDTSSLDSDEIFKMAILESVRNMSVAEMRELKISAGLMLDAFASILKK